MGDAQMSSGSEFQTVGASKAKLNPKQCNQLYEGTAEVVYLSTNSHHNGALLGYKIQS